MQWSKYFKQTQTSDNNNYSWLSKACSAVKFVSDLQQFRGFSRVHYLPSPVRPTTTMESGDIYGRNPNPLCNNIRIYKNIWP